MAGGESEREGRVGGGGKMVFDSLGYNRTDQEVKT